MPWYIIPVPEPQTNLHGGEYGYYLMTYHWYENVIISMIFPSLTAPEVVKMTTSGAVSDENLIKMTFLFQCMLLCLYVDN